MALGEFVWYDLTSPDPEAAIAFYSELFGWKVTPHGDNYHLIAAGETGIGGMLKLSDDASAMGARPSWLGYVSVESVDELAARVQALGGRVYVPPSDVEGAGRFTVVADPQGAVVGAYQQQSDSAESTQVAGDGPTRTGHFVWHELASADLLTNYAHYQKLFGWQVLEDVDMGPQLGLYRIYGDTNRLGGMFTSPPGTPAAWMFYIRVDDVHATHTKAMELGCKLINGPHQVPGGSWTSQFCDPQGAAFAITGPGIE